MSEAHSLSSVPADWQVTRLTAALGAEIRGLDIAKCKEPQVQAIWDLLHEHQVLFFPEQHPSVDDHVAFGRHFGELEGHPNLKNAFIDHPEVFELSLIHI